MENNVAVLWNKCLNVIKDNHVAKDAFKTWFLPIKPISYINNVLTLGVPSEFFFEYLEENYVDLLRVAIHKELGNSTRLKYKVLVDSSSNTHVDYMPAQYSAAVTRITPREANKTPSPFHKTVPEEFDSQLNPKYIMENFFEGKSNRLARAAGVNIADNPGKTPFNPFFIYGHVGVGKTHLSHAIGIQIKEKYPEKKVLYVSAHLFKVQFADAGRFNKVNDFINFYQSIDVLIIDDIQELAGIEKTQNTFFHIFNHLHQNNKQLILTSDKAPAELNGVEERLLTRFRWGLTAHLETPDRELRMEVIREKMRRDGLELEDSVIEYIVDHVTGSIRDLEGVLASLVAHAIVLNTEISLEIARRVISQTIHKIERKKASVPEIEKAVCNHFNIKEGLIHTASRKREITQARQVTMFLSKELLGMSYTQIGKLIGKRNHATVLHGCKAVQNQLDVDKNFREELKQIERSLQR